MRIWIRFGIFSGPPRLGWQWDCLLAIFFVRSAVKKKKGKKQDGDYGTEGMCLGMCFGTALGGAIWNDTGIGISLGMLVGLVIGSMIHKNQDSSDA